MLGRPDAPVFPGPAEAHPDLRPFLDAAGILRAEHWLDVDHGVARRVCRRTADVIPAPLLALKAGGAGRLAVRAPPPEDAVLERLASAFLKASHG